MYKIIYAQNKFETQKKENWKQYDELSTLHILKMKKWLQKYNFAWET